MSGGPGKSAEHLRILVTDRSWDEVTEPSCAKEGKHKGKNVMFAFPAFMGFFLPLGFELVPFAAYPIVLPLSVGVGVWPKGPWSPSNMIFKTKTKRVPAHGCLVQIAPEANPYLGPFALKFGSRFKDGFISRLMVWVRFQAVAIRRAQGCS